MQGLFRRPSGVYFLRISVPISLRSIFGKCEVIASTGTTELSIAKMVAGAEAAQWRQRFFDAGRLSSLASTYMTNDQELIRIAQGHPTLHSGGHLTVTEAATACGLSPTVLLGEAAESRLSLFVRTGGTRGHMVPLDALELDDPEIGRAGGFVIPDTRRLPEDAVAHICRGMMRIPSSDLPGVATALLGSGEVFSVHAFEVTDSPGMIFIPSEGVSASLDRVEMSCTEVEVFRKSVAATIDPKRLREARTLRKDAVHAAAAVQGKKAHERLSTALAAYIQDGLRQKVAMESEITRIRNGCNLLIELEGDLPLAEIDTQTLRRFRDAKLSLVPADENKIRLKYHSETMAQSIKAVEGMHWPIMSVSERDKRMRWIGAWFKWLHKERWIAEDPAMGLRGESVLSKAERRDLKSDGRDDEARDVFTSDELKVIFSAPWFQTGKGKLTKAGTYRTYSPMRYWLPLLGLFSGGGRINELCQLHLDDVRQTANATWYVDINQEDADQRLKSKASRRIVPLHPILLELGFGKWHAALVEAGYTRLFPELKLDTEKGYGKAATKWFTQYMSSLGIPRDGTKAFHSFRHTYTNALPEDTPERIRKQLTGHTRGADVHDKTYRKDVEPELAAPYVNRLQVSLPVIAPFDIDAGLVAIKDALQRKNRGAGAQEDLGPQG